MSRKNQQQQTPETKLTDEEKSLKNKEAISKKIAENIRVLEERVGLNKSFDVVFREMTFATKQTGLFYINGFAKDDVMTDILTRMSYLEREDLMPNALKKLLSYYIPYIQVEQAKTMSEVIEKVLIGATALFIEQQDVTIIIDARSYPERGMEEPSLEKVVRGARDGFTESLLMNVTLVRRRIRDPRLKLEAFIVGTRTRTNVCIGYINDIADIKLVESIRDKINKIEIDGIPLADKQLEEALIGKGWNPYPLVRYSERPDTISTHLLEGHIIVFVDTSPSAMIMPTTFFHHVQHAEEYRQNPFVGSYLRWVRFIGIIASLFILPLWFLFTIQPDLLPDALSFIGPKETGRVPILLQFLVIEVGVDLLRMAAVHTPTPIATAMGLVAAVLIGEIAIEAGLFVTEVILYASVAAIGMFATPSYELGLANRIVRLLLLVLVALFKIQGLMIGTTIVLLFLIVERSYNSPYMWPFIPFNAKAFFSIIVRRPIDLDNVRPSITKPQDSTRQPKANK